MSTTNRRRERGAAAVEMALVLPMLLLVVGGIVDLGFAFFNQQVITNAARDGARMYAMGYDIADVEDRVESAAMGVDVAVTPVVTCPPSNPDITDVATIRVTRVGFEWMVLDGISGFFGASLPAPNLEAEANMRCTG